MKYFRSSWSFCQLAWSVTIVAVGQAFAADIPVDDLLDLSIEQLVRVEIPTVVGASKYAQKSTEAASSVTVISASEIKQYGYSTLADVLRSVRGLYVTNNRNYNFLGVRGFSRPGDFNSRVLVLIDGHRINDASYGQGSIEGVFPLDVDLIDRVEIIRGPGAAVYGTGAFFGVINVVPKRGQNIQGFEVSARTGSYDTQSGRLTFAKRLDNGVDAVLSASGYSSNGVQHLKFPELATNAQLNNGIVDGHDAERWKTAYGSLSYGDFTLEAVNGRRTKFFGDGLFGSIFNESTKDVDAIQYVDLQYQHHFAGGDDLFGRVYYHRYDYNASSPYDYPPVTLNEDIADNKWWGSELKYSTQIGKRHHLTVGGEYVDYQQVRQANFDVDPYFLYFDSPHRLKTWALYMEDSISITDKFAVNLGMRHDHLYGGLTSSNPRLGLIYNPTKSTSVKLLYGTAFRAPNGNELYYDAASLGYKANANLGPEKIRTLELALEQGFGNNLRGIVSIYQYRIKGLITPVLDPADGLLAYQNLEKTKTNGLDLELQTKWARFEGRASYSYQDSRNETTGAILSNAPKHLIKLNGMTPIWGDRLSLGVEAQYTAARNNDSSDGSADRISGYTVTNVTLLSRNWYKSLELSGGVRNVFDKRYGDPTSGDDHPDLIAIPQDGRTYWVKVGYKF